MPRIPLLILSDAPTSSTGLGRICRDLATRIYENLALDIRVGTLGYGGTGSRNLGFSQYAIQSPVTTNGWFVPEIQHVWEDFAGSERGVVLTIWDASRMRWLSQPSVIQTPLSPWLASKPFDLWGYFPIDASGPNGKLTAVLGETIKGYDRALCYSKWAEKIVSETIGPKDSERMGLTSLPHGIDTSVFKPHDRAESKRKFRELGFNGLTDSSFLVGMVATNQPRKDFGLGIEVCSRLLQQGLDVRIWIHTDTIKRAWDMVALLTDFGLIGRCVITTENYTDEQMAGFYSACDVTLGIGLGEGWGLPLSESIGCGTPVVHGNYGGGAEFLQKDALIEPTAWRYEGQFNCLRPVFDIADWVRVVKQVGGLTPVVPDYIKWENAWKEWEKWFRTGVE